MYLNKLELKNIRSFAEFQSEFSPDINLIYGENGKGKTTILEAINLLSLSRSFRSGYQRNIRKFGTDTLSVIGEINSDNVDSSYKKKIIEYRTFQDQKRVKINGAAINSVSELVGVFPVVVMSPENIEIISGSAQNRRDYLNQIFSTIDSIYLEQLKEYRKIKKQRNVILHSENFTQLDVWSKKLSVTGLDIWQKRNLLIAEFLKIFNRIKDEILPEWNFKIIYKSSQCKTEEEFHNELQNILYLEKARKRSLFGPHRDDLVFLLNNKSVRNFGSQGEKKLLLSILKNAEAHFIAEKSRKKPTVLLDDLFAKFDNNKCGQVLDLFINKFQTFITTTDASVDGVFKKYKDQLNMISLVSC